MKPILVWFRQDLRLADNPALAFAAASGKPVIPLFTLDDETPGRWRWGGAARWWLHHSLIALGKDLDGKLVLRRGPAANVIDKVIAESGADAIVWNRCYEPFAIARDLAIKKDLAARGVRVESFNGALLFEPWEIATGEGKPYRMFTPFWRALKERTAPAKPAGTPQTLKLETVGGDDLSTWTLLPRPDWARNFPWKPGEAAARPALKQFLNRIESYHQDRDLPHQTGTSLLSPHLNWGEISPRQIWQAVRDHPKGKSEGAQTFLKELGWREFCHHLLFHFPRFPDEPFDARFAKFPWRRDSAALATWQKGQTGIPIVDAGMRQLWQTGWMHNRVRMIVASFLTKHLLLDWRAGQDWFWDTLVDAGLANNSANWQWVAGSGADAAPFFRVFNPVLQGEKFDPAGAYVRRFVPELKDVPDKFIHRPWDAPVRADYPPPIVDLASGRARALAAFKALKA